MSSLVFAEAGYSPCCVASLVARVNYLRVRQHGVRTRGGRGASGGAGGADGADGAEGAAGVVDVYYNRKAPRCGGVVTRCEIGFFLFSSYFLLV